LTLHKGTPPFFFLVNGQPIPIHFTKPAFGQEQHAALWRPTKVGFFELDGEGHSDTVTIRLK
jgi:hypothetical protein